MKHTRGSHSDDFSDTEPCHCDEVEATVVMVAPSPEVRAMVERLQSAQAGLRAHGSLHPTHNAILAEAANMLESLTIPPANPDLDALERSLRQKAEVLPADWSSTALYKQTADAIAALRRQVAQAERERDEARGECSKAESLWKQEAVRAERLATTNGGLERAGEILLAQVESAELALTAARKEAEQLRELLNVYNLGGWTDAERLLKERDAARREVEELRASCSPEGDKGASKANPRPEGLDAVVAEYKERKRRAAMSAVDQTTKPLGV